MTGILLIDKSAGYTSFDVVAVARRLLNTKKIGHTGTLDPMATGVLPLLIGRATRAADILPRSDKAYVAEMRFGITTDTFDISGKVLSDRKADITEQQIVDLMPKYTGSITQTPPIYSAVKVEGVRLYKLARQGAEVQPPAREVTIYELKLLEFNPGVPSALFYIHCSKGTYIRSLCSDLGRDLGCGAILSSLRRTMASGFSIENCITLEKAENLAQKCELTQRILPVDKVFEAYPQIRVTKGQAVRFANGGPLSLSRLTLPCDEGDVRVYSETGNFLGVGTVDDEKQELRVKKLFFEE